jgi:hypothetical protein
MKWFTVYEINNGTTIAGNQIGQRKVNIYIVSASHDIQCAGYGRLEICTLNGDHYLLNIDALILDFADQLHWPESFLRHH